MRVLLVYYNYPQLSATYIEAEIRYLIRKGCVVEVWSETDPGAPYSATCRVHRGRLNDAVRSFRPDVVHIYWLKMAEKLVDQIDCKNVTARSHSYLSEVEAADRLARNEKIKAIFLFPDQMRSVAGSEKFVELPVAYDSGRFRFPDTSHKEAGLVVGTTAGLPAKSIGDFFETARLCPDLNFILAVATCEGHVGLIEEIRGFDQSRYPNIELLVDVPHHEIPPLLERASAYLCTQKASKRGMPIAIAEALASGCFVMVPEFVWLTEMVEQYGAGYSSPAEAAQKLIEQYMSGIQEAFVSGASKMANIKFSDNAVLPIMTGLWDLILETDEKTYAGRLHM